MGERERLLATLDTPQRQLIARLDELIERATQTNELLAAILDATNFTNTKDKKHGKK